MLPPYWALWSSIATPGPRPVIKSFKSCMSPSHRNACVSVVWSTSEVPTTRPAALMPLPKLLAPPSVPRSCMIAPSQKNACCVKAAVNENPVISLEALMPRPSLTKPPSVPRSCISSPS